MAAAGGDGPRAGGDVDGVRYVLDVGAKGKGLAPLFHSTGTGRRKGEGTVASNKRERAAASHPWTRVDKYCDWLSGDEAGLVLDVGCGDGTSVEILSGDGIKAVGIDLSLESWPEGLYLLRGDGYHLPFRDDSFDAVGSFTTLEHLDEPVEFLREMVRVVRPQGRVVIAAPNMYGSILLHPGYSLTHTGGFPRYAKNFVLHLKKHFESLYAPERVEFDTLEPDMTHYPRGATDYDAICATDPSVVRAVLKRCGIRIKYQSPSLVYPRSRFVATVAKGIEVFPVFRDLFGGIFIVGEKVGTSPVDEAQTTGAAS